MIFVTSDFWSGLSSWSPRTDLNHFWSNLHVQVFLQHVIPQSEVMINLLDLIEENRVLCMAIYWRLGHLFCLRWDCVLSDLVGLSSHGCQRWHGPVFGRDSYPLALARASFQHVSLVLYIGRTFVFYCICLMTCQQNAKVGIIMWGLKENGQKLLPPIQKLWALTWQKVSPELCGG